MRMFFGRAGIALLVSVVLISTGICAPKDDKEPFKTDEGFLLNIKNADMAVLLELYSRLTEKAVLPSSQVTGKVNIINNQRISREEAISIVESVLELNGFSTVIGPKVIKVVPKRNAVKRNIYFGKVGPSGIKPADRVETHLVGLKNINATNAKSIVTPLLSDVGNVTIDKESNVLVLTEVASNSSRLVRILRQLDVAPKKNDPRLSSYPVQYAPVNDVVKQLSEYFKSRKSDDKNISEPSFMSDKRLNAVLVTATDDIHREIPSLLKVFDRAAPGSTAENLVVRLSYAKAATVAQVLGQLFSDEDKVRAKDGSTPKKVKIVADEPSNTLIISADRERFPEIRDMVATLDVRSKQVLVKAIIMEVTLQKGSELGISWSSTNDNNAIQSNMGTPLTTNPFSAAQNSLQGLKYAWFDPGKFTSILHAIVTESKTNILSSPHIMTVDNKTAEIRVGQEVPYTKDSRVSDTSAVIKTNEYRKVGVTLKVTPRITENCDVLLDVEEEISGLLGVDAALDAPIFFTREAKATVIVRSGHTVVIGGLIKQENTETSKKIPILGDLPLIKHAFRYKERGTDKTELIAFLTPIVIGDDGKAEIVREAMWKDFRKKIRTKNFKQDMEHLYDRVTKVADLEDAYCEAEETEVPPGKLPEDNPPQLSTDGNTYIERLDPPVHNPAVGVNNLPPPYNKPVIIKNAAEEQAPHPLDSSLSARTRKLFEEYNKGVVYE